MNVSIEALFDDVHKWPEAQRREWAELVTMGDALGGIVHDINNSLNSIMLQASLLQLKADESLRQDIVLIRQEGSQIAARMTLLQRLREQFRNDRARTDLNAVVQEVVSQCGKGLHFQLMLDAGPFILVENPGALKRLAALLLGIARSASGADAEIEVKTLLTDQRVHLVMSPSGMSPADHSGDTTEGLAEMERLAAQSLARLVSAELTLPEDNSGNRSVSATWRAQDLGGAPG
jgi:signal transduction histidine kinase